MGKLLMIREDDHRRIERLKKRLRIARKVDVLRAGMDLLEARADRQERSDQWRRVAGQVAASSRRVNTELRPYSRLRRG